MKRLCLFISLIACFYTQETGYNFTFSGITVSEALLRISERLGYDITFSSDQSLKETVNRSISDADILTVLNVLLPIDEYSISLDHTQKKIIIRRKKVLISGRIFDQKTNSSIPYVNVFLKHKKNGAFANEFGYYSFYSLEPYADTLVFSSVGYQLKALALSEISDFSDVSVYLQDQVYTDTTTNVTLRKLSEFQLSEHRITVSAEEARRSPISADNDILENLKYLPAANAGETDKFALSFYSRDVYNNVFLIDGIRIFYIDHFFGNYGIFDGDALSSINIYPIHTPLRFTDALSSVVELFSKDGNYDKPQFIFSLNVLNANFTAGVKLADNMSVFTQIRRSIYDIYESDYYQFAKNNTSWLRDELIPVNTYYYDHLTKLSYNPTESDELKLTVFLSKDINIYDIPIGSGIRYPELDSVIGRDDSSWRNTGLALNWFHQLDTKTNYNLQFTYSGYNASFGYVDKFGIELSSLKFRLFSFISDNFQVTTGLNLDNYQSSYETTDNLFQSTVFFDSRFSQSRSVVFNLGSGIQKNRNKISLANTRIAFSSQVADHLNMSIAYSKAFENVSQVSGDFESSWLLTKWALGSNYNIYPEATHLSFDTNWNLDTGKEIAVTIYQKKIFDISNTNFFLTEINTKRTSSQGINLSYHQLLKNLDFTTTYNFEFYNIIVDANLVYGIVSRDYRKHSFKSLLKYQLGDWFFNLNYVRVFSKQIDLYREKSQTISELWPFYEKLDLGIQRKIYLGEMNCEMSLTLNNIFDRKQIQTELLPLQYIDVFLKKELALQGFTALFSFKLSF